MENSILEENSFTDLLKLRKYFSDRSQQSNPKINYSGIVDNLDSVILSKYRFEADNEYFRNNLPEN